jgi:hypothetical protein
MANELAGAQVGPPQQAPQAAAPAIPSPFADVAQGSVPAVALAPIEGDKTDPAQKYAVENLESLAKAGIEYHEIADTAESVFFNPAKLSVEQIEEAYKAGKLHEIAPLVTDLAPVAGPAPAEGELSAPAAGSAPLAGSTAGSGALQGVRLKNATAPVKNGPVGALSKRAI